MQIKSLGIKSDLIFRRFSGEVEDKNDYVVVKTPFNQDFFWGNYIIFPHAPKKGDYFKWTDIFKKEFHDLPAINHMTFIWDENRVSGMTEEFIKGGFELDDSITLSADAVTLPGRPNVEIDIRPILSDADWEKVLSLQVLVSGSDYNLETYLSFVKQKFTDHRKMIESGKGSWFGAFIDDVLVGDLGVFVDGDLGRFQAVETNPSFRKRGICKTLVYYASQYAFNTLGAKYLVLEADEDYIAATIYKSLGYKENEKMYGLCLYDQNKWNLDKSS